jgi:hypothetical protein
MSFLSMLKEVKAKAEEEMDSDIGIMGAVVPVQSTKWSKSIESDPLSVLIHIGYKQQK